MADKSKWVIIRDSVLDSLQFDKVTEQMKSDLTKWLLTEILPMLQAAAESFIIQIKEQAASESGWCKIRDLVVLPFLINGALWLVEQALSKTVGPEA